MNSANRLDWDRACSYRRGRSGSYSDDTTADMAATAALSFYLEKGGGFFRCKSTLGDTVAMHIGENDQQRVYPFNVPWLPAEVVCIWKSDQSK